MRNVTITPETEITRKAIENIKKRNRRRRVLHTLAMVAVTVICGFLLTALICINADQTMKGWQNEYTASAATVAVHHGGPKYHDPIRLRKAVIVKAMKVRGIDTDCINAQQMKWVTLNKAIDTDGQIWLFYTTYTKKPKYRTFKYEVVTLWIYNNHTKDVTDDEVFGVGGECLIR